MGGGTPRASAVAASHPDRPPHPYPSYHTPSRHTTPLSVISRALSVISRALSVISRALSVIPHPSPSFLRPYPSFLRRQEPTHLNTRPLPQFIPPPSRGEVRWGVERREHPLSLLHTPIAPHAPLRHTTPLSVIPAPLSVIPAQAGTRHTTPPIRHSCAGRNPPTSTPAPPPIHPSPPLRGEVRWGVERRARAPTALSYTPITPPSFLRRNDGGGASKLTSPCGGRFRG